MENKRLLIVVPCYNEEEIIEYSIKKLLETLDIMIKKCLVSSDSKICFIDDGSFDKTGEILRKYCKNNKKIALISLNKNYGQQYALLAGLYTADFDAYITIDADMQDDPRAMIEMIERYHNGYEIVYGCRKTRNKDLFFKKFTAELFYKFMNLIGIRIIENHSEFRLMSKFAVEQLKKYKEKSIFLRGLIQNIGLKSCKIYYDRLKRNSGKTKYSFSKLLDLAWCGIVSFSFLPLKFITAVGFLTFLTGFLALFIQGIYFLKNCQVQSLSLIFAMIIFFSGIIITSIGIIGEYMSKILIEVKNRPLYQIESTINL